MGEHFAGMLYGIMNNCISLKEVTYSIVAYKDKPKHLGLTYTPSSSTLSDASSRKKESFFGSVYGKLCRRHYKGTLPNGQTLNELFRRIFIINSTTISLFKAIMKYVGRKLPDGRSKGGIKVYAMLKRLKKCCSLFTSPIRPLTATPFPAKTAALPDSSFLGYKDESGQEQLLALRRWYITIRKKNVFFSS